MGCGLFTEDMIQGFQKLVARPDLDAKAAKELIDAIPTGGAERYLTSVNELLKADHAFKDANTLRRLVDHPSLQTMLLHEPPAAFQAMMRAAGGDVLRAEMRGGSLEVFKRRAYDAGGKAEYERLLNKLASGDAAAEDALRHARRANGLAGNLHHEVQDLVIDAVKTTDRAGFNTAKTNLRKHLSQIASPEQITSFERALETAWRVERLELSNAAHGLSRVERIILEDMPVERWNSIFYHAERRTKWYGKDPKAAVYNVKGLLAEEIFYTTPDYLAAFKRAQAMAAERGLDPSTVRVVRSVRGQTVSEITGESGVGELTDGVIVANPTMLENGVLVPDFSEMHVLTVMESKSPSNVAHLAGDKAGAKLPKNWVPDETLPYEANYFGQMSEDFERFSGFQSRFGSTWFPPEKVRISRHWTEWIAIHPPGHPIPASVASRLFGKEATATEQAQSPMFRKIVKSEGHVNDEALNKVAESIFSVIKL